MISIIAAEGKVALTCSDHACLSVLGLLIFRTFAFWQKSKKVLTWLLILAAVRVNLMMHQSELNSHLDRFALQVPSV